MWTTWSREAGGSTPTDTSASPPAPASEYPSTRKRSRSTARGPPSRTRSREHADHTPAEGPGGPPHPADGPRDQAANRRKGSRGGRPVAHDSTLYQDRDTVERCIDQIKEWRGPATRFVRTPDSYLAGLHLRGAMLWIRSLPATP
ncbi:transposase IS4 family protein [Streptomyces sparsogenes DSM 40356]|uniref:Transposase IS4 family protein n=1 Tax=Streptomyces sparsogenes DSM 40356 TaxID=1331668 RepID=A0A1R1SAK9_9ACTN|nr:transposase IS4 family protein [Streptomyces sparsogenes DSM 40356]